MSLELLAYFSAYFVILQQFLHINVVVQDNQFAVVYTRMKKISVQVYYCSKGYDTYNFY
jgi:hypothetical protein